MFEWLTNTTCIFEVFGIFVSCYVVYPNMSKSRNCKRENVYTKQGRVTENGYRISCNVSSLERLDFKLALSYWTNRLRDNIANFHILLTRLDLEIVISNAYFYTK